MLPEYGKRCAAWNGIVADGTPQVSMIDRTSTAAVEIGISTSSSSSKHRRPETHVRFCLKEVGPMTVSVPTSTRKSSGTQHGKRDAHQQSRYWPPNNTTVALPHVGVVLSFEAA
jgi:hypothetical protein